MVQQSYSARRTLIVGGGSGLGAAIAKQFIKLGCEVIVSGRNLPKLEAVSLSLGQMCSFHAADITDESSLASLMSRVGKFDYLVVTASSSMPDISLAETTADRLSSFVTTKLLGAVDCAKAAEALILPGGSITFVSGALAQKGRPGTHVKAATNAALEGLTRALAVEFAGRIRVNCISPSMFDSKGTMLEERKRELEKMYPAGYVASADDIAALLATVAMHPFMSASVVHADGGWLAT